jgi:hypothetical protein
MRLTPNISKNFSYLYGISPLEDNTEHLSSFLKKYLEAQQVWASENIKNEPENVIKSIYYIGKVKTAEEDGILKVLY